MSTENTITTTTTEIISTTNEERVYAIAIPQTGDEEVNRTWVDVSCNTCGYPLLQVGHICPSCETERRKAMQDAIVGFERYFNVLECGVHVHGVGLLDPYERGNEKYVDG